MASWVGAWTTMAGEPMATNGAQLTVGVQRCIAQPSPCSTPCGAVYPLVTAAPCTPACTCMYLQLYLQLHTCRETLRLYLHAWVFRHCRRQRSSMVLSCILRHSTSFAKLKSPMHAMEYSSK